MLITYEDNEDLHNVWAATLTPIEELVDYDFSNGIVLILKGDTYIRIKNPYKCTSYKKYIPKSSNKQIYESSENKTLLKAIGKANKEIQEELSKALNNCNPWEWIEILPDYSEFNKYSLENLYFATLKE